MLIKSNGLTRKFRLMDILYYILTQPFELNKPNLKLFLLFVWLGSKNGKAPQVASMPHENE